MAAQLSRIPPKNSQSLDNVDKILDEEDEGEDSNSEGWLHPKIVQSKICPR